MPWPPARMCWSTPLEPVKRKFIEDTVWLNVPEQYYQQYLEVILINHDVGRQNKFTPGQTDTPLQEITLKTEEPIYAKQFRSLMPTVKKSKSMLPNG